MRTLTLTLDAETSTWLQRESAVARQSPAEFVQELLRELADPDHAEGDLIDRLLAESRHSFPPVMTLEEQAEMREEVLDGLCQRIVSTYGERLGTPMPLADQAHFREQLEVRSQTQWG